MSRFIKAPATVPTHYHYMQHQWFTTSTDDTYIPFGASQTEGTSTTTAAYDDTFWIAPFDGKLIKLSIFSADGTDTTDFKLRVNGTLGNSLLSGGTVEAPNASEVYDFTCDQNNTFSEGDVVRLFLEIAARSDDATMTTVWEID